MTTTLNREAYRKLLTEDIAWLLRQPRTLERDHICDLLIYERDHLIIKQSAPTGEGEP